MTAVDASIPPVIDGGTRDGASSSGGAGANDGGVATTGGSGGSTTGAPCPPGFESQLPLVLTGDTVPGNIDLGLASAPETPRNPCGLPEERVCFEGINAEREAIGLQPFIWDGDLADLARSHAADRNQQPYWGNLHGSSTSGDHLYQERAEFLGLKNGKFRSVVENAASRVPSAQAVVTGWMNSSGHRAVILGEGYWGSLRYAACGVDGREWNLEFGQ